MNPERKELSDWVESQFEANGHQQALAKLALAKGFEALDSLSALGLHFEFYPREGPAVADSILPGQGEAHSTWEKGVAGMFAAVAGDHHGMVPPGHRSPFRRPAPLPAPSPLPAPRSILELEAEARDPSIAGPTPEPANAAVDPIDPEPVD